MHVTRADLENVRFGGDFVDVTNVEDFGDYGHAVAIGGAAHDVEAFGAEALEGVWAGAWFVCTTAEEFDSEFLQFAANFFHLFF